MAATEAERLAVLEVLADRGDFSMTSEVGWRLAPDLPHPGRWDPKYRRRALRILKALQSDGLVTFDGKYWHRTEGATDGE